MCSGFSFDVRIRVGGSFVCDVVCRGDVYGWCVIVVLFFRYCCIRFCLVVCMMMLGICVLMLVMLVWFMVRLRVGFFSSWKVIGCVEWLWFIRVMVVVRLFFDEVLLMVMWLWDVFSFVVCVCVYLNVD